MMLDHMSNRAFAWFIGGLLGALTILALLITIAQQLHDAAQWIAYVLAALALLALLYTLYMAWHQIAIHHQPGLKPHSTRERDTASQVEEMNLSRD
jgi:disulfide bond formation protein DsbB